MALVSHETQPPSVFALLKASHAQASLHLCVTFCPKILSSLFSLGKEQVPALTSCYVSRRDLPHIHHHARERLWRNTNKAGKSGGWVTLSFFCDHRVISLPFLLYYGYAFLPGRMPLSIQETKSQMKAQEWQSLWISLLLGASLAAPGHCLH